MKFKMIHENYNVSDLDRSIKFYNEALDLHEVRRKTTDDFIIVYLSNDVSDFELELTWLKDHPQPYNLGECEFHLAFQAEDYEAAHKKHEEICYCAMKILPYQDEQFSEYRTKSVQEFRFELSQGIRSQIFLTNFVRNIETHIKSNVIIKALKQLIRQQVY